MVFSLFHFKNSEMDISMYSLLMEKLGHRGLVTCLRPHGEGFVAEFENRFN